jgi:hypothetical protein
MPIREELRQFYPIDWPQLSAWARFVRAKGNCEACGRRPHRKIVHHLSGNRWFHEQHQTWRDGRGREVGWPAYGEYRHLKQTRVVLATAHLDPSTAGASKFTSLNPPPVCAREADARSAAHEAADRHTRPPATDHQPGWSPEPGAEGKYGLVSVELLISSRICL